jgi:hypothetical protein
MIRRNSGIQHSKLDQFHRGASHSQLCTFHQFVAIQLRETHVEIVSAEMLFWCPAIFIVDVGLDGTKRRLINDQ